MFQLRMSGLLSTGCCPKDLQARNFGYGAGDSPGWLLGCKQDSPEDRGAFPLAQPEKRCSRVLQVFSRLSDGWETKPDYSKSTTAASASRSRAIQTNYC